MDWWMDGSKMSDSREVFSVDHQNVLLIINRPHQSYLLLLLFIAQEGGSPLNTLSMESANPSPQLE